MYFDKMDPKYNDLESPNSDVMWLTFKTEFPGFIFYPNSSWAQGRNRLYQEALKKEIAQGWRYLYYIFLDGDVEVGFAAPLSSYNAQGDIVSPWRHYESFLLRYEPAVGVPDFRYNRPDSDLTKLISGLGPRGEATAMYHYDAIICAVHREAAVNLLPYDLSYDQISWWYTQLSMIL